MCFSFNKIFLFIKKKNFSLVASVELIGFSDKLKHQRQIRLALHHPMSIVNGFLSLSFSF
jgi:hypothetical protein